MDILNIHDAAADERGCALAQVDSHVMHTQVGKVIEPVATAAAIDGPGELRVGEEGEHVGGTAAREVAKATEGDGGANPAAVGAGNTPRARLVRAGDLVRGRG